MRTNSRRSGRLARSAASSGISSDRALCSSPAEAFAKFFGQVIEVTVSPPASSLGALYRSTHRPAAYATSVASPSQSGHRERYAPKKAALSSSSAAIGPPVAEEKTVPAAPTIAASVRMPRLSQS